MACPQHSQAVDGSITDEPDRLWFAWSNTTWQALYESCDDRAYIITMEINVDTFHYILNHGFDTNPDGLAHLGWQSLDAAGALGLVYHYLSSAMPDLSSRYSLSSPPQSAATGQCTHSDAPGSWHVAKITHPVYELLHHRMPDGYYLVADTAFPRGTRSIAGWIQAPLKANTALLLDALECEGLLACNCQLLQLRAGFGWLCLPLDINNADDHSELLEIRNVYTQIWEEAEDADIWNDFKNVLFGEIRRHDRVSRFHRVAQE
ncbi:hypothetical protein OH76DRAFT_1457874 [Lentinus brumalis]|uniref:DDE Tnp4 domain-containing protein n=1 Tax=Lentinus brumalis TaxID=2498619 RepID=A0A371CX96_9APHY|nr:hypothetical protein OH76DRAFT_1457874 [Polyporus brumalis]